MHEFPERAFIAAKRYSPLERMIHAATNGTCQQAVIITNGIGRQNPLSTNNAEASLDRLDGGQAFRTYWQPRNVQQR